MRFLAPTCNARQRLETETILAFVVHCNDFAHRFCEVRNMRVNKHAKRDKMLKRFGIDCRDLSSVEIGILNNLRNVEYHRTKGDFYEIDNVGHAHFVRANPYESHDLYRFIARNGLSFMWDATTSRIIPSEWMVYLIPRYPHLYK